MGTRRFQGSGAGSLRLLMALGLSELALLSALAWWPAPSFPLPGLLLFGAAFGAYALAAGRAGPEVASSALPRGELVAVWGVALALRLALLPAAPGLTDDFWRYLWDGHVQIAGVNPYLHAPGSAALDPLATAWRGLVNNPDVPTIYPPGAQIVFLALATLGGGVLGLKLLWVAADLATGWVLARVARATGRRPLPVLVLWLWSPLLLVETAWNGHLDALGLLGVALALSFAAGPGEARRPVAAGAALAWAALVKLAPAAALPVLARRLGARAVAAFVLVAGLVSLPYLPAGRSLGAGLGTYARHWRFMEGPYALLEASLPGAVLPRAVALACVLAVVGRVVWASWDLERALLWIVGAGLLFSPTLHPWYALWILPMAALRRSVPWILFTGLTPLGYVGLRAYHETGAWPQPAWARLLLWSPLVVLLIAQGAGFGGAVEKGADAQAEPA